MEVIPEASTRSDLSKSKIPKSQNPNPKQIPISNIQIQNFLVWKIRILNLVPIWDLVLGIWKFVIFLS